MLLFKRNKKQSVDIAKLKSEEYKLFLEEQIIKLRETNRSLQEENDRLKKELKKHSK
jgi:hypothetical protein